MTAHTLGDLIATLYGAFFDEYGDEELASVATAFVIADLEARDDHALDTGEEAPCS